MDVIVKDKLFTDYISKKEIEDIISLMSLKIQCDYKGLNPLFIIMLNGAFIFASDLLRQFNTAYQTLFIRYSSYVGMETSGIVHKEMIPDIVRNRDIIIVEDIVDSGLTMKSFLIELRKKSPKSISIAALLSKPAAHKNDITIKYLGKEIPNKFIIGYGLDYDGLGRNLDHLYILK